MSILVGMIITQIQVVDHRVRMTANGAVNLFYANNATMMMPMMGVPVYTAQSPNPGNAVDFSNITRIV